MSPLHIASTVFFAGVFAFTIYAIIKTLKGA
jgi:hypothetical protein